MRYIARVAISGRTVHRTATTKNGYKMDLIEMKIRALLMFDCEVMFAVDCI